MSEASKLLDSLTEDQITMYSTEAEPHIVIGADRFVTVPQSLKRIAVQYDHDVETVTFDCPRYWDNHDMSQMRIYINYTNGTTKGCYIAKNIAVDGDIMHFDWTISREVTQYKGSVAFLVCIKKTNIDGEEINHWNSELNRDMYVSEGLEVDDVIDAFGENIDIITQLLTRMTAVEEAAVTADELETIKNETVAAADEILGGSYSNAIKNTASGKIIRIDDISPVEHTVKGVLTGVEDLNYTTIIRRSKNLINVEDLTVERTIAWGSEHVGDIYLPSGTYTATCDFEQQGDVTHVALSTRKYYDAGTVYSNASSDKSSGRLKTTFTIPEGESGVTLYIYSNNTENVLNTKCVFSNIQIEYGSSDTGYEPYIDYPYEEAVVHGAVPNSVDGTFTIKSVSPTMTVYTDRAEEGATINIEYNMDIVDYIARNSYAGVEWHYGTLVTGTGDQIFMPIGKAKSGDFYFNTSTGAVYFAGGSSLISAEMWTYLGTFSKSNNAQTLTDTVTGDVYTLTVENGELKLTKN